MSGVLLIAEIGVNHDGDFKRAHEMTIAAARAGFDAVKFQYWLVDELLATGAPNAPYAGPGSQLDLLSNLWLDIEELERLGEVARQHGLRFIVTPDGARACRDVVGIGVDILKVGSGDADNPWLLEAVAASGLPAIVSTGMMSEEEVAAMAVRLAQVDDLTVLHGVSAYPVTLGDARLDRMQKLRELTGRPVGLSDHTLGGTAAAAAIAGGAVVVEKHVTWSTSAPGPDHVMSLSLDDAGAWVATLRDLELALSGSSVSADEMANRAVVRKALYFTREVPVGKVLQAQDLTPLRPLGDGVPAGARDQVVGRRLAVAGVSGRQLRWDDLVPG